MTPLEDETIYTTIEVAAYFKFSAKFIRTEFHKGNIIGSRCGSDIRIKGKDALAWFDARSNRVDATSSEPIAAITSSDGPTPKASIRSDWALPVASRRA